MTIGLHRPLLAASVLALCGISAAAVRVGSVKEADPKSRNANLKKQLEAANKYTEELKGKTKELLDKVDANRKAKNEETKKFEGEKKALDEKIEALKKEYEEKKHCNEDHAAAHAKLKEAITGGLAASLLHANRSSFKAKPAEDEGADKMKYLEENKVLEQKFAAAKDEIQHYTNEVAKYEAVVYRSDVSTEHWKEMFGKMKLQYKATEESLQGSIDILDKKCAEVEDLKKAEPEVKKTIDAVKAER